jgi:hypothetical protein
VKYLSVCAGIETKRCSACDEAKPLEAFHRQKSGKHGRHCYCKDCYNARYCGQQRAKVPTEQRRQQNVKARYGLTMPELQAMADAQARRCGICEAHLTRYCVDHDHSTGRVRGLLCHRCNILIGGWDDQEWRRKALQYLGFGGEK